MTGLQLLLKVAATAPKPGLLGTSTQSLSQRIVKDRVYPALAACPKTAPHLAPEYRWASHEVRLTNSPWYVAWSGSATQLADLSAYYGWANEIDKWTWNESHGGETGEGDPLDQYMERFKEFWNYKILFECSPTTKSRSRIAKKYRESDRRRYWVPCPVCGVHQTLRLGSPDEPGGIKFAKPENGVADAAMARATAFYECRHCLGKILDQHRFRMMNAGVWVPEGCEVDDAGIVHGKPNRDQRVAGFQLSSLYSLQLTWGAVADAFVRSKGNPQSLRMFVNGWLAETWEPYKSKTEPEQVGELLATDVPRGVVPEWATYLFAGADRQEDSLPWIVIACGPNDMFHVVDTGVAATEDELKASVFNRDFERADGGQPMRPAHSLLDSAFRTKESYQLCQSLKKSGVSAKPCKGANTDCGGEAYERKVIGVAEGNTAKTKRQLIRHGRGLVRIRVNPYYYEPIIQEQLESLRPGEPGSLRLFREARGDTDFLRELCNAAESKEPSKNNPDRHLWVKRWDKESNDRRDCYKYAICARDVYFAESKRASINTRHGIQPESRVVREDAPTRRDRGRYRPAVRRRGQA
jgi:phage terminase large subunit GpA-like protein